MSKESVIATLAAVLPTPEHEGSVPYMYSDTKCNVTVGAGFMIPDVAKAYPLPFLAGDGSAIQAGDFQDRVKKDFERVGKIIADHKKPDGTINLTSAAYKATAAQVQQGYGLILSDASIAMELSSRLEGFYTGARTGLGVASFDKVLEEAQTAVVYMAFILGVAGLIAKFPKMIGALQKTPPDYKTAAAECKIKGISDARNNYVKGLYEAAQQKS